MVGVGVVPRGWFSRRVCHVGAIWCLSDVLGVAGSDAMRGTLSVRLSRQMVFVCR